MLLISRSHIKDECLIKNKGHLRIGRRANKEIEGQVRHRRPSMPLQEVELLKCHPTRGSHFRGEQEAEVQVSALPPPHGEESFSLNLPSGEIHDLDA